ncbi:MAG: hypothetical protein Q7J04_01640 [Microcella sp.]|nr:hypothetical protein [Microcella sp.]
MHPALTDPKINAPQWPWFRLLAFAGIAYAVVSMLGRVGRILDQGQVAAAVNAVAAMVALLFATVVVATGLAVRKLRALERRVGPESEHRMLLPTFGFGATGSRLLVIDGDDASPRGIWGWLLVEVTEHGVRVHGHPERPDLTRTIATSEIVDAAPGAITSNVWRVPTLNLAVQTSSGVIGLPIGLLRHPLAIMSVDERDVTLRKVQALLGVPRQ